MKKVKEVFKSNPKIEECWVTTDGNVFANEQKAVAHSFNLNRDDRKVQHITRADALKDEKAEAAKKAAEAKAKKDNHQKKADPSPPDEGKSDEKQPTGQKKK